MLTTGVPPKRNLPKRTSSMPPLVPVQRTKVTMTKIKTEAIQKRLYLAKPAKGLKAMETSKGTSCPPAESRWGGLTARKYHKVVGGLSPKKSIVAKARGDATAFSAFRQCTASRGLGNLP